MPTCSSGRRNLDLNARLKRARKSCSCGEDGCKGNWRVRAGGYIAEILRGDWRSTWESKKSDKHLKICDFSSVGFSSYPESYPIMVTPEGRETAAYGICATPGGAPERSAYQTSTRSRRPRSVLLPFDGDRFCSTGFGSTSAYDQTSICLSIPHQLSRSSISLTIET